MAETVVFNDGETSELSITDDAGGINLLERSSPAPAPIVGKAGGVDTEGEIPVSWRWPNRTVRLVVEIFGATSEATLHALEAVVAQVGREGGTLTWTTPGGRVVIFDLITYTGYEPTFDIEFTTAGTSIVTVELEAKPFWRGTPVTLADHTETTLPALVFTETAIDGSVPALGKLVIDEDDADDQAWVVWGQRQRNYSAAAAAALFFKADVLSPAPVGAPPSGAVSTNASSATVFPVWQELCRGQLNSGGAYFSHVGGYRVFARVYGASGNSEDLEFMLEWSEGDGLRPNREPVITYEKAWNGSWRLVDLGTVDITEVDTGVQRWAPRVLVRGEGTADTAYLDYVFLVPVDEGAGEVRAAYSVPTPTTYNARDAFNQAAGNLNGKTADIGGAWTTSGSATDLAVETTGKTAQRSTTSDAGPRFAISALAASAGQAVQVDMKASALASVLYGGPIARWVDANNYFRASIWPASTGAYLQVDKHVAGVSTVLAVEDIPNYAAGSWYTILLVVFPGGQWRAWAGLQGGTLLELASGQDAVLATGGALASGQVGFRDSNQTSTAVTRNYDNFLSWTPPLDAAMFASQSLTIHHDKVRREDSTGTYSVEPSIYEGDHLLIPPTGPDNRTNQFIVKASRNVPGQGADSGIDDISARITYTPRGLEMPA